MMAITIPTGCREKNPDGYRYSRFCDLYRRWLRRQEVVLRQEHRAGEKLFVDYAGDTIAIHSASGGDAKACLDHPAQAGSGQSAGFHHRRYRE